MKITTAHLGFIICLIDMILGWIIISQGGSRLDYGLWYYALAITNLCSYMAVYLCIFSEARCGAIHKCYDSDRLQFGLGPVFMIILSVWGLVTYIYMPASVKTLYIDTYKALWLYYMINLWLFVILTGLVFMITFLGSCCQRRSNPIQSQDLEAVLVSNEGL